jgi:hypothetical protein
MRLKQKAYNKEEWTYVIKKSKVRTTQPRQAVSKQKYTVYHIIMLHFIQSPSIVLS